jgi:hypothetical protein
MLETEKNRDEQGKFIPGVSGNPNGRPPDTEQDKIIKKATKELIAEYKESLGEALPLIKPILISKALEGDMTAIKEIHDRVMDKSKQPSEMEVKGNISINRISFDDYDSTQPEAE